MEVEHRLKGCPPAGLHEIQTFGLQGRPQGARHTHRRPHHGGGAILVYLKEIPYVLPTNDQYMARRGGVDIHESYGGLVLIDHIGRRPALHDGTEYAVCVASHRIAPSFAAAGRGAHSNQAVLGAPVPQAGQVS